jgi:8-oxo-dGTP pyrophosphatase MutT (NUDIX family)
MGRIEDDETPAQAAAREVEEETGWRPRQLEPLLVTQPSAGTMDSAHHIFVGTGAVQVGAPVDSYESSAIQWIPLADIPGLIGKQDIHGSTTMASLLLLLVRDSQTAGAAKDGPEPRF